jgi:hypothetical protein
MIARERGAFDAPVTVRRASAVPSFGGTQHASFVVGFSVASTFVHRVTHSASAAFLHVASAENSAPALSLATAPVRLSLKVPVSGIRIPFSSHGFDHVCAV